MESVTFEIKYNEGTYKGHGENIPEIIKYIIERELEELKTDNTICLDYEVNRVLSEQGISVDSQLQIAQSFSTELIKENNRLRELLESVHGITNVTFTEKTSRK